MCVVCEGVVKCHKLSEGQHNELKMAHHRMRRTQGEKKRESVSAATFYMLITPGPGVTNATD